MMSLWGEGGETEGRKTNDGIQHEIEHMWWQGWKHCDVVWEQKRDTYNYESYYRFLVLCSCNVKCCWHAHENALAPIGFTFRRFRRTMRLHGLSFSCGIGMTRIHTTQVTHTHTHALCMMTLCMPPTARAVGIGKRERRRSRVSRETNTHYFTRHQHGEQVKHATFDQVLLPNQNAFNNFMRVFCPVCFLVPM